MATWYANPRLKNTKNLIIKLISDSPELIVVFFLLLTSISSLTSSDKSPKDEKYRVVILTDMTHDDGNSLIRFLHYSPWFDLEALIVTNQLPDFTYNDPKPWNKAMGILNAYKEDLPQLRKYDSRFPNYEELLDKIKKGRGALPIIWLTNNLKFSSQIGNRFVETTWDSIYYNDWIGEGLNPNGESKDSEGTEFLQQVFDKDDDRPIYVQAWGGPITHYTSQKKLLCLSFYKYFFYVLDYNKAKKLT